MPKAHRYFERGYHYHLTHRCHNREFLLKFARDLDVYREMMRVRSRTWHTPILGYSLTSNHVHLLVTATNRACISEFMNALQGDFAQYYNRRKKRTGSFWAGRFHATAVERSEHLWNCLTYIELNMIRAGVVGHPCDWPWCSYGELAGTRKRYRVVARDRFAAAFGYHPNEATFPASYQAMIEKRVEKVRAGREACWTESLAVGSETYISTLSERIKNRRELAAFPLPDTSDRLTTWIARETRGKYA